MFLVIFKSKRAIELQTNDIFSYSIRCMWSELMVWETEDVDWNPVEYYYFEKNLKMILKNLPVSEAWDILYEDVKDWILNFEEFLNELSWWYPNYMIVWV